MPAIYREGDANSAGYYSVGSVREGRDDQDGSATRPTQLPQGRPHAYERWHSRTLRVAYPPHGRGNQLFFSILFLASASLDVMSSSVSVPGEASAVSRVMRVYIMVLKLRLTYKESPRRASPGRGGQ
jgi:hypothetical protein